MPPKSQYRLFLSCESFRWLFSVLSWHLFSNNHWSSFCFNTFSPPPLFFPKRLCQVLIVAHRIFSCCMWYLVPWPGIKSGPSALGVQSLSHCITREIPGVTISNQEKNKDWETIQGKLESWYFIYSCNQNRLGTLQRKFLMLLGDGPLAPLLCGQRWQGI